MQQHLGRYMGCLFAFLLNSALHPAWAETVATPTSEQLLHQVSARWRPSYPKDDWNMANAEADTQATCRKSEALPLPQDDLPDAADLANLKQCQSAALYYGYTGKPDYVRARQCAYLERGTASGKIISGSSILTMIYANGKGVPRNLPLAIKFACEAGGAPAEIDGRIADLEHLQNIKPVMNQRPFDFCDDVTSGYMQGACEGIQTDADDARRQAKIHALTQTYSLDQQRKFAALQRAAKAYFEAHGTNEVDLSGTARAMYSLADEDSSQDMFLSNLQALETDKIPYVTSARFAELDAHLNAIYRRVLLNPALGGNEGYTVTASGVRHDQRLWLVYRNAWIRFAASSRPGITKTSVMGLIISQRIEDLRTWLPETDPDYRQTDGDH